MPPPQRAAWQLAPMRCLRYAGWLLAIVVVMSALPAHAVSSPDEWDFIVVGGGSAGSIVAARLASASHSVLLLEAGGGTQHSLSGSALLVHPNLTLFDVPLYWTDITSNPAHAAEFEWELLASPRPQVARGLGGCSVHNAMIYIRGLDRDFDDWPHDWEYSSVLPAYRRSVQQQDAELSLSPLHSPEPGPGGVGGGEAHLSSLHSDDRDPVAAQFIASCVQSGMEELRDFNGAHRREGAGYYQFLIRDGQRDTPASALFGSDARMPHRSKLRIITSAQATSLIFAPASNGSRPRAVGVQYALLPQSPQSSRTSSAATLAALPLLSAYARREVVLSAGAINSAKLLLLSGIGPRAELEALGIEVRRDLAGVGHNAMDGSKLNMQWEAPSVYFHPCIPHDDAGGSSRHERDDDDVGRQQRYCQHALQTFLAAKQQSRDRKQQQAARPSSSSSSSFPPPLAFGIMGTPGFSAGAFLKSHSSLERPDVQLTVFPWDKVAGVTGVVTMEVATNSPRSRGRVQLSSSDWFDPPLVDLNYLGSRQDVDALLWALKRVRQIVALDPLNSTLTRETLPGVGLTDAQLREYIRCGAGGEAHCDASQRVVGHLAGTVQMGDPQLSELACVDSRLRVIGVDGLRVADASVMPSLPSGNTHATCMMIGERAAEFMLQRVSGDESSVRQQQRQHEEQQQRQRSVEGDETLWSQLSSARLLLLGLLFAAPLTAGYCCLSMCWNRAGHGSWQLEDERSRRPLLSERERWEGAGGGVPARSEASAINNE